MPLSKFYRIVKRSALDFDVIQTTKVSDPPPIPRYEFSNRKEGSGKSPNDSFSHVDVSAKPVATPKKSPAKEVRKKAAATGGGGEKKSAQTSARGTAKVPIETQVQSDVKRVGCDCRLL